MNSSAAQMIEGQLISVPAGSVTLNGNLTMPEDARAVVLFAHGSGSSRHSPRNRYVARVLNEAKLATLLIDLLTVHEEVVDARRARPQRLEVAPAHHERLAPLEGHDGGVADGSGTEQRQLPEEAAPAKDVHGQHMTLAARTAGHEDALGHDVE